MLKIYTFISLFLLLSCSKESPSTKPTVEVRKIGQKYQLYRHGKPYYIKGVGGNAELEKIANYGGNSVRTWSTDNAQQVLDEADRHGLTVTLGLEVGKEWWGEDFSYWNVREVDKKIEELRKTVLEYKDHPALLMWGIGNEIQVFGGNRILIFHTINRIAKMIHTTDPNHPVMTTIPLGLQFDKFGFLRFLCPDLDILGLNAFERLPKLSSQIRSITGYKKPYIISEWGPPGPWESPSTEWGAPYELSSTEKARYMDFTWDLIVDDDQFGLGAYAFYWGSKYETTHTFFSLFPQAGYETETVNLLQSRWSGVPPQNWAPQIDSMHIQTKGKYDNIYLLADSTYNAQVFAHDPEQNGLTYRWEIRPEGKDYFTVGNFDYNMRHLISEENCPSIWFQAPSEEGGFRLLVFVYDGHNHVATDNIPFYVLER